MERKFRIVLFVCGIIGWLLSSSAVSGGQIKKAKPAIEGSQFVVEVEEVVTRYTSAKNGAGPLWCYGSTVIARQGKDVYLSIIETGKDEPLPKNCRGRRGKI